MQGIEYFDVDAADVSMNGGSTLDQSASAATTSGSATANVVQTDRFLVSKVKARITQKPNPKGKVGRNRWGWPKYEWQHVPVEKHELSDLDSQGDLEVKGSVDNSANASADATTDNASARATLADNIGVDLNGAAGLHNAHASITSGGDMDVAGSAALNADASATGVDEDATAEVQATNVKGIDTTVDLKAKGDALLNGSAAATTNVSHSTGDGMALIRHQPPVRSTMSLVLMHKVMSKRVGFTSILMALISRLKVI